MLGGGRVVHHSAVGGELLNGTMLLGGGGLPSWRWHGLGWVWSRLLLLLLLETTVHLVERGLLLVLPQIRTRCLVDALRVLVLQGESDGSVLREVSLRKRAELIWIVGLVWGHRLAVLSRVGMLEEMLGLLRRDVWVDQRLSREERGRVTGASW
jgi:hypothetical protein